MAVDQDTVRKIAHLARIAVDEKDVPSFQSELNTMLAFVEQLNEVDIEGVEPMISGSSMEMKLRQDVVTDGGCADLITANAPVSEDNFFLVPKVVE